MSDNPWRREAKKFEPPPWEKEQFDQPPKTQEGQRVEQEKVIEEARPLEPKTEESEEAPTEGPNQTKEEVPVSKDKQAGPNEAQMEAMLASLKAEEPKGDRALWKWGLAFSALMALIGSVVMIWGIVAFQATRGAGKAGVAGSSIMIFFGTAFIALAGWAAYKILRQQGVL